MYTWNLYSVKCRRYLKEKSSISWLYQCQYTSSKLSSWTIVSQDAAIRSYLYIIVALVAQSLSHKQLFATPWTAAHQGIPVHHQLQEFTQTHVHRVGDAIQPSHPVTPFTSCLQSFPASMSFSVSQFFTSGNQSIEVSGSASVLPVNIQD